MPYLHEAEISDAQREKIPAGKFVFPQDKTWPIQDEKHAKIALIWSTWPQHKSVSKKVRETVFKAYPKLKDWFQGGKYAEDVASNFDISPEDAEAFRNKSLHEERHSMGTLGDLFGERLAAVRQLVAEARGIPAPAQEQEDELTSDDLAEIRQQAEEDGDEDLVDLCDLAMKEPNSPRGQDAMQQIMDMLSSDDDEEEEED